MGHAILAMLVLLAGTLLVCHMRSVPPVLPADKPGTPLTNASLVLPSQPLVPPIPQIVLSSNQTAAVVTAAHTLPVSAPFHMAAKKALEQLHQMKAEVGGGLNIVRYYDVLMEVGAKLDSLGRVLRNEDEDSLSPEAKDFIFNLNSARDSYFAAHAVWKIKQKFPEQDSSDDDAEMKNHWNKAAAYLEKAAATYAKFQEAPK